LLLFVALFNRKAELKVATAVFLIELLVLLPIYLGIKLGWEGDSEISSPLLSFVHRLIVNPLLMFVLMVGLVLQRYSTSGKVW
jgi:cadmium resistance protein CadD (predicted permease)